MKPYVCISLFILQITSHSTYVQKDSVGRVFSFFFVVVVVETNAVTVQRMFNLKLSHFISILYSNL